MGKTTITNDLEHAIRIATDKIGVWGCMEVTIGANGKERVDYMTVDSKGIWRCYEVKCSVSDFRSKAKKTFIGHYNYFVMTQELFEKVKDEIPKHVGVYVYRDCIKKPKKQELQVEHDVLMLSMVRSLARDANKLYATGSDKVINNYERQISNLRSDLMQANARVLQLNAEIYYSKEKSSVQ